MRTALPGGEGHIPVRSFIVSVAFDMEGYYQGGYYEKKAAATF